MLENGEGLERDVRGQNEVLENREKGESVMGNGAWCWRLGQSIREWGMGRDGEPCGAKAKCEGLG